MSAIETEVSEMHIKIFLLSKVSEIGFTMNERYKIKLLRLGVAINLFTLLVFSQTTTTTATTEKVHFHLKIRKCNA